MVSNPPGTFKSILQSTKLLNKDIITFYNYDSLDRFEINNDETANSKRQSTYNNLDKFLFQAKFFDNTGIHVYLETTFKMSYISIKLISLVSVFGTIGGAATIIFATNALMNRYTLKNRFTQEFIKDQRRHQIINSDPGEVESKEAIKLQFKFLFSFEGMYQIFCSINHQEVVLAE